MDMVFKLLRANNGDAIHLRTKDGKGVFYNILIDGGTGETYSYKNKKGKPEDGELKQLIEHIKNQNEFIDLLILTHIDDDHIGGILKWFSKDETAINLISEIWFNSGASIKKHLNNAEAEVTSIKFKEQATLTSIKQGVDFEKYIKDKRVWDGKIINREKILNWNNLSFQILSPSNEKLEILLKEWTKKAPESLLDTSRTNEHKKTFKKLIEEDSFIEDTSHYNGSSIAFILKHLNLNYLFLGDSHPTDIIKELRRLGYSENNKLIVEFIKIAHHGSAKNNPIELFRLIDTNKYVISTNGNQHDHPDKLTLARIVTANPKAIFYFNYPHLIDKVILREDVIDYPKVQYLAADKL